MRGYYKDAHRYDDMLDMPHHQSLTHPHMSLHDRAAQFAPFAALTGHDDAIEETARLTDEQMNLDENETTQINEQLAYIAAHVEENICVSITYFKKDKRKTGGAYLTDIGTVKKIDDVHKVVVMDSGMEIAMGDVVKVGIV